MFYLPLILLIALAPPVESARVIGTATALTGDRLAIGSRRIQLDGIVAPRIMQSCHDQTGGTYPCGRVSVTALEELVRGRTVECTLSSEATGSCAVGAQDVAVELLTRGAVIPSRSNSPDQYRRISSAAQANRRGLWRGRFIHPEEWDAAIRRSPIVRPTRPRTGEP